LGTEDSCPCPLQHSLGAVHAHDIDIVLRERNSDPSGAASELEYRTVSAGGEALPERHVTPAEGPRVLPVVEWRVLVPPTPPFRGWHRGRSGRPRPSAPIESA